MPITERPVRDLGRKLSSTAAACRTAGRRPAN